MESLTRQRPLGITIIAIVLGIIGILTLLAVILGFVGVAVFVNNKVLDAIATIVLVFGAVVAIAEIVVAWGLWTLKVWAYWTAVVVEAIRVVHGLYDWLIAHNPGVSIVSLIIAIVILVYLLADPNVRAAFRV
jgi:uncharacterized membrane protein (DUF2068 family)